MVDLVTDNHLIGFWPMDEPSGTPTFKNYSPSYAGKPSGISFDLHQQQATVGAVGAISEWLGNTEVTESGAFTYRGVQLHGNYQSVQTVASRHVKYLTIGHGGFGPRHKTLTAPTAQSGFTFGLWVLPQSDGYDGFVDGADNSQKQHGLGNALFFRGDDDHGIMIGVSGQLIGGSQFSALEFGGPHRLTGYVYVTGGDTANPSTDARAEILETPLESGQFVHLTCSYRYIDGTVNEVVLYKNGRVTASGTTDAGLHAAATPAANNFDDVKWAIGASVDDGDGNPAGVYDLTTGWNHLVSGAYYFARVLHEGEVQEMHERGGLQRTTGNIGPATAAVSIDDTRLLAYYSFAAVGYADASRHHRPLIAGVDEGDRSTLAAFAGPFGRGGLYKTSPADTLIASSGLTFAFAESTAGFTIGIRYAQQLSPTFPNNVLFSFGTCGTTFNPTVVNSTMGLRVSRDTTLDRVFAQVFPIGDENTVVTLTSSDFDQADRVMAHMAFAYSVADDGFALYIDGELHASGTAQNPLMPHMLNLAASGFPLAFIGGIAADNPFVLASVSDETTICDISIFDSPLGQDEIRAIAQSGIDIVPLMRTPHDPRLAGYWPCTDFDGDDVLIEDRAKVWQNEASAPLRYSLSDEVWDELELLDNEGPWIRRDEFVAKTLPPELASFGNLGITSGAFTVNTQGSRPLGENVDSKSSVANFPTRWRANPEDNDLVATHPFGEYIIMFDVTPSGTVPPALEFATNMDFNSVVFTLTDNNDEFMAYLTSVNAAQGSGISLCFMGREVSAGQSHVSGEVPYGVPTHVMYHMKWDDPNNTSSTALISYLTARLYIAGVPIMHRRMLGPDSRLWPDQQGGASLDEWMLNIGGEAIDEAETGHATIAEVGLGGNYVRNFTIMRGTFSPDDIRNFAVSGIEDKAPLTGFNDGALPTTQVTTADAALEGYWRFSGQPSGETDLGPAGNDLVSLAKQAIEDGVFTPGANVESAYNIRFLPGPLLNSDLGVKSSGISYLGDNPSLNPISPYVASGVAFQDPGAGFSIGLWLVKRSPVVSSDADVLIAYGVIDTGIGQTAVQDNAGWAIFVDEDDSVRMVLSSAGNMHLDDVPNAANSGLVTAGTSAVLVQSNISAFEAYKKSAYHVGSLDSWQHYMWTYDATTEVLKCYQSAVLVDERVAPTRANLHGPVHNPIDPSARLITFLQHQEDASAESVPWVFGNTRSADDQYITDVCYFSRALDAQEVAYIAYNGIDQAEGVVSSGIVGGFIHGQETASGIIAGYFQGLDTGSGLIGGFIPGGNIGSGLLGGFVSGVVFGDGTIGGFVQGLDIVSGIIAGYIQGVDIGSGMIAGFIHGQDIGSGILGGLILAGDLASGILGGYIQAAGVASGILGGFMLGGLQGNFEFDAGFTVEVLAAEDFDAQLEIAKTVASDFDAKLIIFQDELPPLVEVLIPGQTVTGQAPPFNQYFIGKASGQQGKTITQTKWTFGDLTPTQSVAESGAGCYPIQHFYATSGFYVAKFEAIDSDGMHNSATRIINAASGIDPVLITLSGVPRSGDAVLLVDFTTTIDILPPGVSVSTQLLNFDDGQTTISFDPTHAYSEPGTYKPVWCIRDSRGFFWCDSLEAGSDIEEA